MFPLRFWQWVKVGTILASFSASHKLWLPPLEHRRACRGDGCTDEGDFESTPLAVLVWKVGGTCGPNRIQGVGLIKVVDFGLRLFCLRCAANSSDLTTSVLLADKTRLLTGRSWSTPSKYVREFSWGGCHTTKITIKKVAEGCTCQFSRLAFGLDEAIPSFTMTMWKQEVWKCLTLPQLHVLRSHTPKNGMATSSPKESLLHWHVPCRRLFLIVVF